MTSAPDKFDPPNWLGGPALCRKENLPAFATLDALNAFTARYAPSVKQVEKWQCDFCGCFHVYSIAASPGGDSSGQGRNSKWKARALWHGYFHAQTADEMLSLLEPKEAK